MTTVVLHDLRSAAEAVHFSQSHLRREIHAGRLAAKRVGQAYRITAKSLEAWADALPDA